MLDVEKKAVKRKRMSDSPVRREEVAKATDVRCHVECDSSGISDNGHAVGITSDTVSSSSHDREKKIEATPSAPPIRIKVRIQEKLLLVPIPSM